MRLLDEIHLERPFYGSRRLRDELETQGHPVNRKRVQRLMRQMGLSALYPKPRNEPARGRTQGVSLPAEGPVHSSGRIRCGRAISATSPMARGVHVSGGHPGLVLAPGPGLACVKHLRQRLLCRGPRDALTHYGPPAIFNTDQGAQFTSQAFTAVLKAHAVAISMDGQGTLGRQRVRRASLAQRQIRGCVSPCIRDTRLASCRADLLLSVLQRATAS